MRTRTTTMLLAGAISTIVVAAVAYGISSSRPQDDPTSKPTSTTHSAHSESESAGAHAGEPAGAHAGEEHADEVTLTTESLAQSGIKLEKAQKHVLRDVISIPGRIAYNAEHMAHVGTSVAGRVVEVKAKLGDVVRKGDALFVLDSAVLGEAEAEYLQKSIDAQVTTTTVEIAQAAFERARRLVASNAVPGSEYQVREGELKKANGAALVAQAALRSAESKLHLYGLDHKAMAVLSRTGEINPRLTITAPIDGTVIEREATIGEVVSPDRDALLVLADMTSMWVLADLPEAQLQYVTVGTSATLSLDTLKDQTLRGQVTYIAPALNRETRTAQVRVELHDAHILRPGMFAHVSLELGTDLAPTHSVLAVPETAIQTFEGGPVVFIQSPEGPTVFAACPVKLGESAGGMVPVLSGLKEDTLVVTAASFLIKAEMGKAIMEGKTCSGH